MRDIIISICFGGVFIAAVVWLNLKAAAIEAGMTEEERRKFREEVENDMRI